MIDTFKLVLKDHTDVAILIKEKDRSGRYLKSNPLSLICLMQFSPLISNYSSIFFTVPLIGINIVVIALKLVFG